MGFLAWAATTALGGAAIYCTGGLATPFVASVVGVGSTGIAAGSLAAGSQSFVGNLAAGSIVSTIQAVAMAAPTP